MEQEKDLQVVFIKDLIFAALYQWRKIVIFALVFAMLLGGYAGVKEWTRASAPQSEELYEQQLEAYNKDKALLEDRITAVQKHIASQKEYMAHSLLMQLNAYQVQQAVAVFSIQLDETQQDTDTQNTTMLQSLLHSYNTLLKSTPVLQTMAQIIDAPVKYVQELVKVQDSNTDMRTLRVSIRYDDAEKAEAMLDAAIACLQANQAQIAESIGSHTLALSTHSVTEVVDTQLITTQADAYVNQQTLETSLKDLQLQMAQLSAPQYGDTVSVKKVILFAFIGAFLGAALVAGWSWLCYIAGGTVYSARTLKNRTGIKILGCIPDPKKNTPIDNWLKKLEGRCMDAEQAQLIAAAVANYCANGKTLLVTKNKDYSNTALVQTMTDAGVTFRLFDDLTQDAAAVMALPACDAVILIANCGTTRVADVDRALEIAADHDKPVLGCVLING